MSRPERLALIAMIAAALAGTIWYIALDLQASGSLSGVGWALIAGVWFIVLRRVFYLWRRRR